MPKFDILFVVGVASDCNPSGASKQWNSVLLRRALSSLCRWLVQFKLTVNSVSLA